ncbi:MAG: hypothetical protein JWO82_2399 [Akkermansiaceae bacterium]|nr:hypothetical protein [Akkermansiaceae bacterium]
MAMNFFDFMDQDWVLLQKQQTLLSGYQTATNLQQAKQRRADLAATRNLAERVTELERELGQAGLVIESLLQLLEESGTLSREALTARVQHLDAADGVVDGLITPPAPPVLTPPVLPPGVRRSQS